MESGLPVLLALNALSRNDYIRPRSCPREVVFAPWASALVNMCWDGSV